MGLSDEERISGVFANIKHIMDDIGMLKCDSHPRDKFKALKKNCKALWHDFLGSQRNGAHWILGSSAGNKVKGSSTSPWGLAVLGGIEDACKEDSFLAKAEREYGFDCKQFVTVKSLLTHVPHDGQELSMVFHIYAMIENLIYYVRRYEDDLARSMENLSRRISTIMGLCYEIFSCHEHECAKAYVLHQIFDLLLPYPYRLKDEDLKEKRVVDGVCAVIEKLNLHHDITEPMSPLSVVSLKELCQMHKKLLTLDKGKKLGTATGQEERLYILVRLCNRRLHYEHQHKDMKKILAERKTKYNAKKLDALLASCIKLYQEKSKQDGEQYSKNSSEDELWIYHDLR